MQRFYNIFTCPNITLTFRFASCVSIKWPRAISIKVLEGPIDACPTNRSSVQTGPARPCWGLNNSLRLTNWLGWGQRGLFYGKLWTAQVETFMASVEHEPITGVWGQSPQRGPGEEPLVRGSGAPPPWSWQHFSVWTLEERGKLASLSVFCNVSTLHHGCLVGLFYAFITSFTKFIFMFSILVI